MTAAMSPVISPYASASLGGPDPTTTLTCDGQALIATDPVSGQVVRLTPSALYHYRHEIHFLDARERWQTRTVTGLAALDPDGLIMLDLPGHWHPPVVHDLMVRAGLPIVDGRNDAHGRVRAILAGRAPGWRRLHGIPRPRWQKPLVIGAGTAGLALMAFCAYSGAWGMWRAFAGLGRLLSGESHWLAVLFSPLLLVLRPLAAPLSRWRTRRRVRSGAVATQSGPLHLDTKGVRTLRVMRGRDAMRTLFIGDAPGAVASLLTYQLAEGGGGLFFLDAAGQILHHAPGRWSPEEINTFATRHGLSLQVLRLTQEEYLTLLHHTPEATP
ncbi:hypothetical protein ACIBG8_27125 [Nonomuraea sp. NPDC050556]|uniref:hypothetical protein n=1 Tax=Nonomuraea sp. NPDC050556 TaxID=3364369 RepID=UPI0037ABA9D2